jgi:hypothetical protein
MGELRCSGRLRCFRNVIANMDEWWYFSSGFSELSIR